MHFPYQSFDYLIRFLMEAAFDPKVDEIKITQYRVAENSAVINKMCIRDRFYEIRVAEHRGVIMKKNFTEESGAEAEETLAEITEEVNRQQREYYRIFSKVLQELNRQDIYLYQDSRPEPFHEEFVHNFFNEEVFPFLSPVMIQAGDIRTFIRDRRLYLVIRMVKKSKRMAEPDVYKRQV